MIAVEEVIDRSTQGRTEPFICRGSDGEIYYVKGRFAGRESQIKEYVCGSLAAALDLPVAPFAIVDVPRRLIELGGRPDLNDLGHGPAFASRRCGPATEITFSQLSQVEAALGRDVLVFDWWVRNGDRILTAEGGNPNLLWDQANDRMVMIDHNLAFDRNFDAATFAHSHVFHELLPTVFEDLVERLAYTIRLKRALSDFPTICDKLPEEWLDEAPAWFSIAEMERTLGRCDSGDFWRVNQ